MRLSSPVVSVGAPICSSMHPWVTATIHIFLLAGWSLFEVASFLYEDLLVDSLHKIYIYICQMQP